MNAKDYLQRIGMYDELITNKRWELAQMRSAAQGITSYSESIMIGKELHNMEKVQSSGSPQRMADTICSYVDMARTIEEALIRWEKKKQAIIDTIQTLPVNEYRVLHMVYVRKISLQEAATECDRSYSWAKGKHASGLESLQRILDEREA